MRAWLAAAAALALAACSSSSASPRKASADLDPRSGSTVTGHVDLVEQGDGVKVDLTIAGAPPGKHGVHVHQVGDCSAEDASSARDHWNPGTAAHGGPSSLSHHAGDFGNVEVGTDGRGALSLRVPGLTIRPGERSIVGHAIVVHAGVDDLTSQPAGNSGARVACGVVAIKLK